MTGRYVRSTFVEHQREFVEHFQYGKQIGKILDIQNIQKRHQAQKPFFWVCKIRNLEICFQSLENGKYQKYAHGNSVHNGCDAFPNELMRFRFEAKPIRENTQTHC